jgi:hypothetical protein
MSDTRNLPPLSRDAAMALFRQLVARHGLQWTVRAVPGQSAWDQMTRCNAVLSTEDRREALGLKRR